MVRTGCIFAGLARRAGCKGRSNGRLASRTRQRQLTLNVGRRTRPILDDSENGHSRILLSFDARGPTKRLGELHAHRPPSDTRFGAHGTGHSRDRIDASWSADGSHRSTVSAATEKLSSTFDNRRLFLFKTDPRPTGAERSRSDRLSDNQTNIKYANLPEVIHQVVVAKTGIDLKEPISSELDLTKVGGPKEFNNDPEL